MGQVRSSLADAVWFRGENPQNPMMVSAVLWFEGELDEQALRRLLRERLVARHPVFRQRLVPATVPLRMPTWVDDERFDLDDHLEVSTLPAPGTQETLEAWCSRQRSQPLDRDRPLWHVHLMHGYRGGDSALHLRIHHSIGDGLALMTLLLGLADEATSDPVPVADDPPPRGLGARTTAAMSSVATLARRTVQDPARLVRAARTAVEAAAWAVRLLVPQVVARSVLIGRPDGTKRMTWDPVGLPLDDVRRVAHDAGATVNDVLLAALTAALRGYLRERDSLVDEVLVMVPVSLRPPDEPLPRHLGNRIGLLPIRLPTGLRTDGERLRHVRATIAGLRGTPAPVVSRAVLSGTALLTPPGTRALHRVNQVRSSGVVTNVRGPAGPVHLTGTRLEGVIGWGGMTGHLNLSVAFVSLTGRIFVGLVTDAAITADPQAILDRVRREWTRMAAVGTSGERAAAG